MENLAPTKANLLKTKDNLALAQSGYKLIDKKRTVLIKEMMQQIDKAKQMQEQVTTMFAVAYMKLQEANITNGIKEVSDIATSIDTVEQYDILYKNIMGLDIPTVNYKKRDLRPNYSMYLTDHSIDEAIFMFRKIKHLIYRLAETENTVYKLSLEIKKNQKRANALDKIQIPKYKEMAKYIESVLEEKEREDFFRLKKIKNKKQNAVKPNYE